jgi:hypothetical protein
MLKFDSKDYLKLITLEAKKAFQKIKKPSIYDVNDLVQEGLMEFYKFQSKYNEYCAKFITVFTIVLRNKFCNIIKKSYRSVDMVPVNDVYDNIDDRFEDNFLKIIDVIGVVDKLNHKEKYYIELCLNPTDEMVLKLKRNYNHVGRRGIIRKMLGLSYGDEKKIREKISKVLNKI